MQDMQQTQFQFLDPEDPMERVAIPGAGNGNLLQYFKIIVGNFQNLGHLGV